MLVLIGVDNINYQSDSLIVNAQESSDMVYVGSPINSTGTLNNVYFNTSLTIDEIKSIFDSINFPIVDGVHLYIVFADESGDNGITILKALSNDEYVYTLNVTLNRENYRLIYASEFDNFVSSLVFNNIIGIPMMFNNPIGQENGLLSTLISITPFEYVSITDTEWKGTAINPLGTYDKIYLNISLSDDDVLNMVNDLPFVLFDQSETFDFYVYAPYILSDFSNNIVIIKVIFKGDVPVEYYTIGKMNTDLNVDKEYWKFGSNIDNVGWQDFDNPISFSSVGGVDDFNGALVGQQNDLLSSLISSTPFYRVLKENNNNQLDGFVGGIFQDGNNALIGLSTLFASGVNALFGVFWANGTLTVLGIALAFGVGVGVIYFLFNLIRNWISRVKG